jgi:hypothetical protein
LSDAISLRLLCNSSLDKLGSLSSRLSSAMQTLLFHCHLIQELHSKLAQLELILDQLSRSSDSKKKQVVARVKTNVTT